MLLRLGLWFGVLSLVAFFGRMPGWLVVGALALGLLLLGTAFVKHAAALLRGG